MKIECTPVRELRAHPKQRPDLFAETGSTDSKLPLRTATSGQEYSTGPGRPPGNIGSSRGSAASEGRQTEAAVVPNHSEDLSHRA
jgi:hypothetical protein